MANKGEIDRLSNLPDDLLLTIISFLPTHIAARTSVLCRRFRHLWEASPSLNLNLLLLPNLQYKRFIFMAKRALLYRNVSHTLLSLKLKIWPCKQNFSILSSLLAKARSLDLRHLTIEGFNLSDILPIIPIIFTINSLRCLSLDCWPSHPLDRWPCRVNFKKIIFPSGANLTCLRHLSLTLYMADSTKMNQLISELCSLEDLDLDMQSMIGLSLSSRTIKNLKLKFKFTPQLDNLVLSLPSLELLHLETFHAFKSLSTIRVEVPLLRKVVINFNELCERDVSVVARLLNCISHVEELSLHIRESKPENYPIPILSKIVKDVQYFSNLKHLDATLCFHEYNLEAVTTMLHNCPVLESITLNHEVPMFMYNERRKKRKGWESKLPCNADGNKCNAYFRNLHMKENRKEAIKLLSKKCSSKRQACSS